MKVLMINGSPHEHGCTYTALHEVEKSSTSTASKRISCIWAQSRLTIASPAASAPGTADACSMMR